jgi:hypothetical protein
MPRRIGKSLVQFQCCCNRLRERSLRAHLSIIIGSETPDLRVVLDFSTELVKSGVTDNLDEDHERSVFSLSSESVAIISGFPAVYNDQDNQGWQLSLDGWIEWECWLKCESCGGRI